MGVGLELEVVFGVVVVLIAADVGVGGVGKKEIDELLVSGGGCWGSCIGTELTQDALGEAPLPQRSVGGLQHWYPVAFPHQEEVAVVVLVVLQGERR